MGKGLRSNRKKAVRTLRRNEVATSKLYQDREAAIQARLQTTLEAGRAARQLADQMRAAQPGEAPSGKEEAMDVDAAPRPMQKLRGIPLTKKKALKLKKLGGKRGGKQAVQSVFKRKGKGKKHKGS